MSHQCFPDAFANTGSSGRRIELASCYPMCFSEADNREIKMIKKLLAVGIIGLLSCSVFASEDTDYGVQGSASDALLMADNPRQERRDDRHENRDDKQDCRQEEGRVGDDKRDCKQDARGGEDGAEADGPESDGAESDA
jgi:hypothetical protein